MRRTNQISYGDLFSSSNFSQSSYESRFKRHPSETCSESSQGNSQLMFSQAETSDSQINSRRQSLSSDVTMKKLSPDSLPSNAIQKQSVKGGFQQIPFKSGALPQLGLCRAKAQEFEERENMELVLSSLKTYSSEIKEFGYSFQEKLDNSAVLSENLVTKFFENIKETLSGQFLDLSKAFINGQEVKTNDYLSEIRDVKLVLENHSKILENLSQKVDGSQKLADTSLKSVKKEFDESLCIYAKEETDLLRCFKEKIENDFTKKFEFLACNIFQMLSQVQPKKVFCDKDTQVDTQFKDLIPSTKYLQLETYNNKNNVPKNERNYAYNMDYSYNYNGSVYSDYSNSNIGADSILSNDFSVINLSFPKSEVPPSVGSTFDSAIESRMSTPLNLSMKKLSLIGNNKNNNNNNNSSNEPLIESRDEGMDDDDEDDDYNDYDELLSSIISYDQSPSLEEPVEQKNICENRSISLEACTYQTTHKMVAYWGADNASIKSECMDLSRASNISDLSFNCPKSTPLSHIQDGGSKHGGSKHGGSKDGGSKHGCDLLGSYQRQTVMQIENLSHGKSRSGRKKVISRSKKQSSVRRSRRLKKSPYFDDPDYDLDMECLEGSDKENCDPNVVGTRSSSRTKKRVMDNKKTEEDCSCESTSTKSSSDGISQLFTVLDIF